MNYPNKEIFMVKRKRRSFSRDLRPESTTSERWTNIKNPQASARFSMGERVAWDEGDALILGRVAGFTTDPCEIQVELEDGTFKIWPTVSPRLRRIQTPDYQSIQRLDSSDYDSVEIEEQETTQPIPRIDFDPTEID